MKQVYGYAVIDKDGKRALTKRAVYDTKNAAANGFNQYAKSAAYYGEPELAGKKLREQDKYRVVGLVADVDHTEELFKLIEHGGDEHREWLYNALRAYFNGTEMPEYAA